MTLNYWVIVTAERKRIDDDFYLMNIPFFGKLCVVFQGEKENSVVKRKKTGYEICLTKNIFEYGAWSAARLLIDEGIAHEDDWFIMLHDTCLYSDETAPRIDFILCVIDKTPLEMYFFSDDGWHNLCCVRKRGLTRVIDYFRDKNELTKQEAVNLEGRSLMKIAGDIPMGCYLLGTDPHGEKEFRGEKRLAVNLPSINMCKFYKDTTN